jgi:hypothetical protein
MSASAAASGWQALEELGRATAGLGRDAAGVLAGYARRKREQAEVLQGLEAFQEFREAERRVLEDPESGLLASQGQGAQGAAEAGREFYLRAMEAAGDRLEAPGARAAFLHLAAPRARAGVAGLAGHQAREYQAWKRRAGGEFADLAARDIARNPDPESVGSHLARVEAVHRALWAGLDPGALDKLAGEARNRTVAGAVRVLAGRDAQAAADMLSLARPAVDADLGEALEQELAPALVWQKAGRAADEAWEASGGRAEAAASLLEEADLDDDVRQGAAFAVRTRAARERARAARDLEGAMAGVIENLAQETPDPEAVLAAPLPGGMRSWAFSRAVEVLEAAETGERPRSADTDWLVLRLARESGLDEPALGVLAARRGLVVDPGEVRALARTRVGPPGISGVDVARAAWREAGGDVEGPGFAGFARSYVRAEEENDPQGPGARLSLARDVLRLGAGDANDQGGGS